VFVFKTSDSLVVFQILSVSVVDEAWYLGDVVQVGGWWVKCLDNGSAFVISIHVTKIVLDSTRRHANTSACSLFEFIYFE